MKFDPWLEPYRVRRGTYASVPGADYGAFDFPGPCGVNLYVIASPGDADLNIPWEHVSVSTQKRCPNWTEMCFVKDHFWDEEETVMQLHPPKSRWINNHLFVLHLWRPLFCEIPLPPDITVGIKSLGTLNESH